MSFTNSPSWMYNPSTGFYSGVATQSLRFDDAGSAYLQRTPSSAANRQTFTISCWVKRSTLGLQGIFSAKQTKDDTTALVFENSDQLLFTDRPGNARNIDLRTNRLFRDVGAWYHIVVRVDTTQGTSSNRVRLYINGEQETSFATSSYPSQNYNVAYWNNTQSHRIGIFQDNSAYYYDGYIAEFNNVGSSQAPTAFGETKNDIWIPKAYSGSYGTNGFRLEFNGNGNDSSGNGNNFTTSGVSTHDYVSDCPENNFCTFNALDDDNITLSEGNLQGISTANAHNAVGTTFAVTGGKWYWEVRPSVADTAHFFGMGRATFSFISRYTNDAYNFSDLWAIAINGNKSNGSGSVSYGSALAGGDILNIAFDLDNGKFYAGKNGTYFNSGDPVNGTNPAYSNVPTDEAMMPFYGSSTTPRSHIINFGQDSSFAGNTTAGGNTDGNGKGDFKYAPPSGFLALCSANLPVGIDNNEDESAKDYFNTVRYTGNGGSSTLAVTGMGFSANWLWFKNLSSGNDHNVYDTNRGLSSGALLTNTTANEDSVQRVSSIDADGFTLPATLYTYVNTNGNSYVTWGWKAGGSASSNSNGSITSSVSASQEAGFSIVTYTGNGSSGATIGHGLSQAPDLIITKFRQGGSPGSGWLWPVFHKINGTGSYLRLNATDAPTSNSQTVKVVGSSTYTIGSDGHINQSSGNFVAYVFHEVEGFSKFGKYIGNGSSDGVFIYTGFRPAFFILKGNFGGRSWRIYDNQRNNPYNPQRNDLLADSNQADSLPPWGDRVDFLSNGVKMRGGDLRTNGNGNEYIYIAFADQPFKYANAR